MGFYAAAALTVILVSVGLVLLIRRNLRQRVLARRLRALFLSTAEDLIGKPEFPDRHARQLFEFSAIPGGWLTRYAVFVLLRQILTGKGPRRLHKDAPTFEQVPPQLRAKYVTAVLAFALSDSYRCAILGRIWRGANAWIMDAVNDVQPDVNAHATRSVVDQVGRVHAPKHVKAVAQRLECAV